MDPRSRPHEEDMGMGYEENLSFQTFDSLEKKFLDDIMKLANEQNDAEDVENARHREKLRAINAQYEKQLAELRAQHTSVRDELLRKESHARQQKHQEAMMDYYSNSGMGPGNAVAANNLHGYSGVAGSAAVSEAQNRALNSDHLGSYRERARFLRGPRDHGLEARGSYPGGRVYDTGPRYH